MTKKLTSWITAAAFTLSPTLYGEEAIPTPEAAKTQMQDESTPSAANPAQVGKAAEDGQSTSNSRMWVGFGIAVGAAAIAAAALVLVSQNSGSHSH